MDGLIWAGTDDGLVWKTRDDGAHWENVTPPALTAWSKVAIIEPSHFDAELGLRGRGPPSARRPRAVHLPDARWREDLVADRAGHSRRQLRQRRARGSRAARTPLCGHGDGRLRLLRRRRAMAGAPGESAELLRARPRRPPGRPRRGHAREVFLGPRRPLAAAPARREVGRGPRVALRAADGRSPPPGGDSRARPSRRTSRSPRTRRGERSSTTSSGRRPRDRSSSRSSTPRGGSCGASRATIARSRPTCRRSR